MLSFEEKKQIFDEYDELVVREVSLNRLNYHFEDSAVEKTIVVKYLHPKSNNAFIYAGYLPDAQTKDGYISVRDANEEEIRQYVQDAIDFLKKTRDGYVEGYSEEWCDEREDLLILQYSNGIWMVVLTTGSVEAVFKTREAAESYLVEEGFLFSKNVEG